VTALGREVVLLEIQVNKGTRLRDGLAQTWQTEVLEVVIGQYQGSNLFGCIQDETQILNEPHTNVEVSEVYLSINAFYFAVAKEPLVKPLVPFATHILAPGLVEELKLVLAENGHRFGLPFFYRRN
jgi:hypothetical protein